MLRSLEERFWSKVDMSGGSHDCWPWTGCRDAQGYGRFSVGGSSRKASGVALALATGAAYGEKHALHRCDNPPCCNPEHLFAGDNAANVADRVAKGRTASGPLNGLAKLTAKDVIEIRERFVRGCPVNGTGGLAKQFGVDRSTICRVANGLRYVEPAAC